MKPFYIIPVLFLMLSGNLAGQFYKTDMSTVNKTHPPSSGSRSLNFSAECMGFRNVPTTDVQWRAIVNPVPIIHYSEEDELVQKLKAERQLTKLPAPGNKSTVSENQSNSVTPVIGSNFIGNHANGSSPLDNSIAISNGNIIVSVTNTTILYSDTAGNTLFYQDFLTFINDPAITGVCDPVVIYDPGADHFIFFCEVSPLNSATSKLLIFFTKTNNPADGWWYYKVTGNPLNDASAFDYPKLGLSNNELYITGNLFRDSDHHFDQAVLFQFTKGPAYSGGTLDYTLWYGIDGSPFTICPVSNGQGGNYGPGCYLVATSPTDASTISFYDLTNDRTSGNAVLNYYSVNTTAYKVAPNAAQYGTTVLLNTNDSRTLGGFYLNGVVHFVFHSMRADGYCGINYNRLTVSSLSNTSSLFGLNSSDYCYPSVVSYGSDANDQSVMIGFCKSNSMIFPSVQVVNCDNEMNWSVTAQVRTGDGYVHYTVNPERWGDYSGTCRKYNASRPLIWMSGSFGAVNNQWDTWIAQIHDNSTGILPSGDGGTKVSLYPNPVVKDFSLEFTLDEACNLSVTITDANGKEVKHLFEGKGYAGKNILSFNKANLKPGIYFLTLRSDNVVLKNEKVIISD
jgi:hypothetical protein